MKRLFINSENRLRCGWRLLSQFIFFLIVLIVGQFVQGPALREGNLLRYMAGSLVYMAGMMVVIAGFSRQIDRRPLPDFGLRMNREWLLDLLIGFAIGAITLIAVAAVETGMNWALFERSPQNPFGCAVFWAALAGLINMAAVAWGEEVTFRGYQIKNLAEGLRKFFGERTAIIVTLVVSSTGFGVAHLLNPNADWLPVINIVLAGLLMGLAYIWTGSLGLPLGIHTAWGFFEEYIFGFANSGQAPVNSLIQTTVTGPDLWTGGLFGPEGGLLISLMIVLDICFVYLWLKKQRRWQGIHSNLAVFRETGKDSEV